MRRGAPGSAPPPRRGRAGGGGRIEGPRRAERHGPAGAGPVKIVAPRAIRAVESPYSKARPARPPVIPGIVLSVAQLKARYGRDGIMTGSGFFYESRGRLYYITNRHLVVKEGANYYPEEITLSLRPGGRPGTCEDVPVCLYRGGRPAWTEHPRHGSGVDVVSIPIGRGMGRYAIRPLTREDLVPGEVDLDLGQDLMVLGFPQGLGAGASGLPLARSASLASPHRMGLDGRPYVLIDSRLHPGTSGSPVLTRSTRLARLPDGSYVLSPGGKKYLVGIHSAGVSWAAAGGEEPQGDSLGLHVCWSADLLDGMT